MLQLNTIKAQPGATHKRKRLGRGSGSGHGVTAGKGDKGQLARSGGSVRPGFEGGQMPLYRRIPKRGFTNFAARSQAVVNLADLETRLPASVKEVSMATLLESGIVRGRHDRLAVLGTGEIKRSLTVRAHKVSPTAAEKIQKAGGKVEIIPAPGANLGKNKKLAKRSARK